MPIKALLWRLWWWRNAELTCFIMLPHYLEWRTPASFDKWTSRFTTASFESKSIILSPTWKKTMIKPGTLNTPEDLLFCLARKKGLKFNLEISTAKRNLYWANGRTLSFGVWSQQGEERCPTLIGGSTANKTIQLQCTDWPFVSIVQIIPPTFILINFNWTACVLGSSCNSGQCSEDAEADLINLT